MKDLILILSQYDFYDWEQNENIDQYVLKIGMPADLLADLEAESLYESFGVEAVNNEYANPSYSPEKWLELENQFFIWLKKSIDFLFLKGETIVTPNLKDDWRLNEDWHDENKWMLPDYNEYLKMLQEENILNLPASLKDDYRGALIENEFEVEKLGRMATKGVHLLFFQIKKWSFP
ncbi:hypothetical protein [Heyndrickxia coagulans]|uniref:hypothetical protein n=1 Tax=Heyndrickxia coagulans TaxID=1398 RepID=UPI002E1A2788|nr:hypothetical protein [Heyndrickxia coagulans]MED4936020.1 hypothetical protein [Heyndrickxia coagulans]MED4943295.1 hypothetical protein [Heyndrickxia coagulans]MED4962654.1 hypothetical protein [Heyndrickxia coagulans]MED4967398.1 hypothetical protein [Heyndrickxia coagulans]